MDKKEIFRIRLELAEKQGFEMGWYAALVNVLLIVWIILGALASAVSIGQSITYINDYGRAMATIVIPLIIIDCIFAVVSIFLLIKIRQAMMAFAKATVKYLWIYLVVTLSYHILTFCAAAVLFGSSLDFSDYGVDLIRNIIFLSLNAIYFFKRRCLFVQPFNFEIPVETTVSDTMVALNSLETDTTGETADQADIDKGLAFLLAEVDHRLTFSKLNE